VWEVDVALLACVSCHLLNCSPESATVEIVESDLWNLTSVDKIHDLRGKGYYSLLRNCQLFGASVPYAVAVGSDFDRHAQLIIIEQLSVEQCSCFFFSLLLKRQKTTIATHYGHLLIQQHVAFQVKIRSVENECVTH